MYARLLNVWKIFARRKAYIFLSVFVLALIIIIITTIKFTTATKPINPTENITERESYKEEFKTCVNNYANGKSDNPSESLQKLTEKYPEYPDAYLMTAYISAKNPVDMPSIVPILEKGIKNIKPQNEKDMESLLEIKAYISLAYIYSNSPDDAFKLLESDPRIEKYLPMHSKNYLSYLNGYIVYESEDDPKLKQKYKDSLISDLAEFENNSADENAKVSFGILRGVISGNDAHTAAQYKNFIKKCNPDYRDKLYAYYCLSILSIKSGDIKTASVYFDKMNDIPAKDANFLKDWGFLIYKRITKKIFSSCSSKHKFKTFESNSGDLSSKTKIRLWNEYLRQIEQKKYKAALLSLQALIREEKKWTPCQFKDIDEMNKTGNDDDYEEDMELTGYPVEDLLVLPHKKMIRNILLGSLYEKIGNKEKAEEQFRQAAAYLGVKKVNYRYP
jgi:hypothetical protein